MVKRAAKHGPRARPRRWLRPVPPSTPKHRREPTRAESLRQLLCPHPVCDGEYREVQAHEAKCETDTAQCERAYDPRTSHRQRVFSSKAHDETSDYGEHEKKWKPRRRCEFREEGKVL